MIRKTLFIGIYAILLLPVLVNAQENWTLDQCISYAYEHNIQLKQQELQLAVVSNNLSQSKLDILPELNAGAHQTFRFGRSVDPLTYEFSNRNSKGTSFSASTGVTLFNGLQGINIIRRNELDLKKNLADLEEAKYNLALSITRLYLEILFNRELLDISQEQVRISIQQLAQTEKLFSMGALARGDLLEIKALLASEELNEVNASNQLELSSLDLAQLLDLENPENFSVTIPNFDNIPMGMISLTSLEIYEASLKIIPRIKSAKFELLSNEKELQIARGKLSPSLVMYSSWGTGYSDQINDIITGNIMPFNEQIGFASTTSLRFSLNIPVFDNWAARTTIKNAGLAVQNSNYMLEATRNQLRKEIQQAKADASTSLERYKATEKSLVSLQESFRYTEKKFALGMLTSLEYKFAKNNLTTAQSELLQARYHFIFNSKILDFYRGIPIKLNY